MTTTFEKILNKIMFALFFIIVGMILVLFDVKAPTEPVLSEDLRTLDTVIIDGLTKDPTMESITKFTIDSLWKFN